MDIPTNEELIASIDGFLARHGMAETRLGREATGEASLISTIRAGRSPRLKSLQRLAAFMAEHDARSMPEDVAASPDIGSQNIGGQKSEGVAA
jgi:hypothetical protein